MQYENGERPIASRSTHYGVSCRQYNVYVCLPLIDEDQQGKGYRGSRQNQGRH